jgi:hypothetical protein
MKLIRILYKSSVLIPKNTYEIYVMELILIMIFRIIFFVYSEKMFKLIKILYVCVCEMLSLLTLKQVHV